jgi:hypothetical protein
MGADRHLDVNLAVSHFLKNFESLSRLPLVTNAEMAGLFGEEVASALEELELYDSQEKICLNCISRCCLLVDCELYSPEFGLCPVQSFRPVLCRMHYCHKFTQEHNFLVKEIGDIFLESLLAAERLVKPKTAFFDSPPLTAPAPGLVASTASCILAFKEGRLDEVSALRVVHAEAEKYRTE